MVPPRGFTLIEVIIVLAVMGILIGIGFGALDAFKRHALLVSDAQIVQSILKEARSKTLAAKGGDTYGVHFASTTVTLFKGSGYTAGAVTNERHVLSPAVTISAVTLEGGGSAVVFKRQSGSVTESGTVTLSLIKNASSSVTLTINKTGTITVQE